ncbi:MAG TPA: secondary thiamine-phosphate synthase enzyme YjbQ [Fusibacter sp.]|nr:secondary thiamine-phosphate synthase enzyme YjbQ [Fusibacter sp.]
MYERIQIKTTKNEEMIEILDLLKAFVAQNKVKKGIVVINIPHTTAAITLSKSYDPEVQKDILDKLDAFIPKDGPYSNIEGNTAAIIKAAMFGHNENLIIEDGHIELGMFQSVYFCEFDGPRKRQIVFKIIEG